MAGKNEVALEFSAPPAQSSSSSKPVDELMEMRFYVPGRSIKQRGSDDEDEERSDDEEEGELDEEGNEISAAQSFHDRIKKAARVGDTAGEEIVSFSEVLVVTPRYVFHLPEVV
jgi:structure-specific recognition protein 1